MATIITKKKQPRSKVVSTLKKNQHPKKWNTSVVSGLLVCINE